MTTATSAEASSASDTAGVIAPPPLIYLGALGVGFGLDAAIGSGSPRSRVATPLGSGLIVAGVGLLGSFARAFRGAQTPIDPYTPSTTIVTSGPYRLTRNPAYLGMALDLCWDRDGLERAVGSHPASSRDRSHRPRRDRARRALPGTEVRRAVRGLQAKGPAMAVRGVAAMRSARTGAT